MATLNVLRVSLHLNGVFAESTRLFRFAYTNNQIRFFGFCCLVFNATEFTNLICYRSRRFADLLLCVFWCPTCISTNPAAIKIVDERPVECRLLFVVRNCKSCITLLSSITRHLAALGWILFHRAADIKEIAVERPPGLAGSTAGSMFGQIPASLITGFPHHRLHPQPFLSAKEKNDVHL